MCAMCGSQVNSESLCAYHHASNGDDWASGNRVWCSFFHRGVPLPRLTALERDDGPPYGYMSDVA